jgi:hypothetical protein
MDRIAATLFATNLEDAQNILAWARTKKLDVVFNMLRFTDAMLNNKELEEKIGFHEREEEFMRKFFLDRVKEESVLSGPQNPDPIHDGVRFVIHDDVVLTVDDLRLVYCKARVFADLDFPILAKPAQIAVTGALRE